MNQRIRKLKNRIQSITIQAKLILVFSVTSMMIMGVNLFMYYNINIMVNQLEQVYLSNIRLNELADTLTEVHASLWDYLNTKTPDALEDYYRFEQDYSNLLNDLNDDIINNPLKIMERNIKEMSGRYLSLANQGIDAKRGRNVEKYNIRYEEATRLYGYINKYIYSLNNQQFKNNSSNYEMLLKSLQYLETVSSFIMALVAFSSMVLITLVTRTITNPLKILASTADQVARGNLNVDLIKVNTNDEVGVVGNAFNKMMVSIQEYIEKLKDGMNKERRMQENELRMEAHLKDAQLKYLQAQINPHFLFNTLNAGAQLAMMEGADRTYEYVQHVADFFRYNVRKNKNSDTVTLQEEIELVNNYIYILNVRFSGKIQFHKEIDRNYTHIHVPSMIIQPIVENSVNYGIRNIDWPALINLSVYRKEDMVCISIKDNGIGMTQDKIDRILLNSGLKSEDLSEDSNGVGLHNVITRLRLLFDNNDVFYIYSEGKNKGTEVLIRIPFIKGECEDV